MRSMHFEKVVTIEAHADAVWAVLTDVESWPELTESISSVECLDDGPLRVGSRVRIKQPRLPVAVWTVTEYVEGQRFVWEAKGPGVRTTAKHAVLEAAGSTNLRLEIDQHGVLGRLLGPLSIGMTRRYIDWEARGLKQRVEKR